MSKTKSLRTALRNSFLPYVAAKGFVASKSGQPQSTTFRRQNGEVVHVFEIHWDSYGGPRFSLTFGEASAAGATRRDGQRISGADVQVCDSAAMLSLQRKPGGLKSSWFQLRRPILQQVLAFKREYSPEEVVGQLIAWFPEVEAWWESRVLGPHLWVIRQ